MGNIFHTIFVRPFESDATRVERVFKLTPTAVRYLSDYPALAMIESGEMANELAEAIDNIRTLIREVKQAANDHRLVAEANEDMARALLASLSDALNTNIIDATPGDGDTYNVTGTANASSPAVHINKNKSKDTITLVKNIHGNPNKKVAMPAARK